MTTVSYKAIMLINNNNNNDKKQLQSHKIDRYIILVLLNLL